MNKILNYIAINKEAWNTRTAYHLKSDFYDLPGFLSGNTSLNAIELDLLGDVKGKSILHLQCHFGQDSLSLSRLGAEVTAVDFSDVAIRNARNLAEQLELDATFICCDIYDLPNHLTEQFDIVYTSYGVVGWLPDMNLWASLISQFLKPKGKLVFVEFHPVVWMFNSDFNQIDYSYFNDTPIVEVEEGTYGDTSAPIQTEMITWNHGIAEIVTALISNNLNISTLQEFNYSPYDCFRHTVEWEPKKFRIKHLDNKIPMVYALVAQNTNY